MPGFTLNDAEEIWGDEMERTVSWKGDHDLGKLAGTPVRLHMVLKDADIYAFQFVP